MPAPAVSDETATTEPDPQSRRSGATRRRRWPFAVAAWLLLAALVAALVVAVVRARDDAALADARRDATQAAQREAVALTTISYTSAAKDLQRIIDGATGGLRTQFSSEKAQFPAVLAQDKSTSTGRVLSAGVVDASRTGTAQVVVAADATVTTTPTGQARQSTVKHYRMVMQLRRVHGRWLVSDVAFAGVPQ